MYRNATTGDCAGIYDLICQLEDTKLPFEPFSSIFKDQLTSRRHRFLVCELDGRVAGVLHLRIEEQLHHCGRIAEIMELAVAPHCRSQGIGKELLSLACQAAEEAGCQQIEVACNKLRTDAHRFYQREGMNNFHYKFSRRSPLY